MSKEISLSRFARFIGSAYLLEACTKAKVLLLLSIIITSPSSVSIVRWFCACYHILATDIAWNGCKP